MPSTMMSLPGKLCGWVSESIKSACRERETDLAVEYPFEPFHLALRAPDFQLSVRTGRQRAFYTFIVRATVKAGDHAGMAAIQPVRQPQKRRPDIDDSLRSPRELCVRRVSLLWSRLAVITGDV